MFTIIIMFPIRPIFRAEDELDCKLKSQEKELRKISTGSSLGKVFLDTVRQREKINAERRAFIDPRSYARTASASREPINR